MKRARDLLPLIILLGACDSRGGNGAQKPSTAQQEPPATDEKADRAWLEEQTPEVRARLERLATIGSEAAKHAPIEAVELVAKPEGTLDLDVRSPGFNASIVTSLELQVPCGRDRRGKEDPDHELPTRRLDASDWLDPAACLAATKSPHLQAGDTSKLRANYETFLHAQHVLVIRAQGETSAKVVDEGLIDTTFESGALRADVQVYRISDGAYEVGFPVVATNSDNVELRGGPKHKGLEEDLERSFAKALYETIKTHLPVAEERQR